MHIAIAQPRLSYFVGGAEVVAAEHSRGLVERGHRVTVITTKMDRSELYAKVLRARVETVEVRLPASIQAVVPGENRWRWYAESLAFVREAEKILDSLDFDVLATHFAIDGLLALFTDRPSILHLHGEATKPSFGAKIALERSDLLLAGSQSVADYWIKVRPAIASKLRLLRNGVDIATRPALGTRQDYDVLFLGRLIRNKGVQDLIRAVAELKSRGSIISVAVVGDGPYAAELRSLAVQLGVEDTFHFLGLVAESEKDRLFGTARMFVVPSLGREPVLLTTLEAAAAGMPLIVTSAGGSLEFAQDGRNALVVSPANPLALAAAIERLLSDPQLASQIAAGAFDDVRGWSWPERVSEVEAHYRSVLT